MKRFDLVEKLKHRDYSLFRDEFELLDPTQMQQQTLDQIYAHEIFHEWMDKKSKVVDKSLKREGLRKQISFCFPKLNWACTEKTL